MILIHRKGIVLVNNKKICFIICINDEYYLDECISYINRLIIPDGYEIDLITIDDCNSMASGYNQAMKASDAKYKIYMHQDTFIINENFIEDIIGIFDDKSIGALGVIGSDDFLTNSVTNVFDVYGGVVSQNTRDRIIPNKYVFGQKKHGRIDGKYKEVGCIWSCLFATQYDFDWDEKLENDWKYATELHSLKMKEEGYRIVIPKQDTLWCIHDGNCDGNSHKAEYVQMVKEMYPNLVEDRYLRRVLYINTNQIKNMSLPISIYRSGMYLETYLESIDCISYDESSALRLDDWLRENDYLCIITYDFVSTIAEAAKRAGVKYLCWAWDSPLMTLYTNEAKYDTSYIYSFDSCETKVLKDYGVNTFYLPLSTNQYMNTGLVISDEDEKRFNHDVCFVGNMYDNDMIQNPEKFFGDKADVFNSILENEICDWSDNIAYSDRIVDALMEEYYKRFRLNKDDVYKRAYFESIVMRNIAHAERVKILNAIASKYKVDLYTQKGDTSLLKGVNIHGQLSYDYEAPKAFHLSKINLNITLHCIKTGVPLRVFDIMGVGGFVMTNYQEDMLGLFEEDKEIVMFRNIEEMMDKIGYYLTHEEERVKILMNGYNKAKKYYTHEIALEKMLQEANIT